MLAEHQELVEALGIQAYFCGPLSPWHYGTDENTNRLLHQHLRKGEDVRRFSMRDLDDIAQLINCRLPRVLERDPAHDRF